jgi:hypothetical protein
MALDFIGQPVEYNKILQILETTPYGAVASQVTHLSTMGLTVIYEEGLLADLYPILDKNLPVITLVRTGELPHWSWDTMHAVLLVGYDEHHFYANDPHFTNAPIKIPVKDFDLAWFEMGNRYAVIST